MPANTNQKFDSLLYLKENNGKRIPEAVLITSLKILREELSHFIKKTFIRFIRIWFEVG